MILRAQSNLHRWCCLLLLIYCFPIAVVAFATFVPSAAGRPATCGLSLVSATASLSHVMLRVPSVDATVQFWTNEMGASIVRSTETEDGTVQSAFVTLGGESSSSSFALELAPATTGSFVLGNAMDYIGVSMLYQQSSSTANVSNDGIPLRRVASAPGDALARWVMHSNDLAATADFYTRVLGMESMGYNDEEMICLRYRTNDDDAATKSQGVSTTLIFTPPTAHDDSSSTPPIERGNCFDHLAISIPGGDIEKEYESMRVDDDIKVFLKPTSMFGTMVMGVIDPNGYKVVLAAAAEQ